MEVTAVVLYDGALAQYDVEIKEDGNCSAYLTNYKGNQRPPEQINLRKEGRSWVSDVSEKNLLDDLTYSIELKAKSLLERKRSSEHPAA
ncbi:MAG: hypothetical protein C4329_01575 [Chitinophagaceae bacterium]